MSASTDLNAQLWDAVRRKDVETAIGLLGQGANVNARDDNLLLGLNMTVLMKACENGGKAMVDLLLQKGAEVNETCRRGYTALMHASSGGHTEIVNLLLKLKADVGKKDTFGMTAIHLAAWNNHPSIINRLVSCGATVDINDDKGITPLWLAAHDGYVKCVDVLLRVGANPHHRSESEGSPLDIAKDRGHSDVVKLLGSCSKSMPAVMQQRTGKPVRRKQSTHRQASLSDVTIPLSHMSLSQAILPTHQSSASSSSGKKKKLVRQVTQQKEQEKMELTVGVGEKGAMDTQIEDLQQQNARLGYRQQQTVQKCQTLTQRVEKLQQQNGSLQRELDDQRQQVENVQQQNAGLQRLFDERQLEKQEVARENAALTDEVATLRQDVGQLQALLTHAETAITEMRESEEVLSIPSAYIKLTNQQLGHGSYAEVRIGYWRQCPVAVKMLYEELAKFQEHIDLLKQEVSVAWTTHHPNVASVCGVTLELEGREKKA